MSTRTHQRLTTLVQVLAAQALGLPTVEAEHDDDSGLQLFCLRTVVEIVRDPAAEVALGTLDPEEGWSLGDERGDLLFVPVCTVRLDEAVLESYFSALLAAIDAAGGALAVALATTFVDQAVGCERQAWIVDLLRHSRREVGRAALRRMHVRALEAMTAEPANAARRVLAAAWEHDPAAARRHRAQIARESLVLFSEPQP